MKKIMILIVMCLITSGAFAGSKECVDFAATDATYQAQIQYFFTKAAIAVMAESAETANHRNRIRFASAILRGQINEQQLRIAVLTNATIAATVNDAKKPIEGDIEFMVNSVFDAFAEAYAR